MLVAISTYLKPLSEVDVYVTQHRSYLQKLINEGKLLMGGRQNPPTGGILIAVTTKEELQTLLKEDPFMKAGAAEYTILEFNLTLCDSQLRALLESMS